MSTFEELAKQLEDAGVVTGKALRAARSILNEGDSVSVQKLVDTLRSQKSITEFQASKLSSGSTSRIVIGDYVLLEPIGHGGMGSVFRAHHRIMNCDVAIKFMLPALDYNENAVRRFHREVRTAGKLDHPRIVRALNAGIHNDAAYLVMEFVNGLDLARLVRTKGPLSVATSLNFVRQIAEGLHYAHTRGVVHRDVKPSNVLYDPNTRCVKILDMGLASAVTTDGQSNVTRTGPTQSGQMLGTADYMSPEQYADATTADPRADLYSLGCTLYFLLNGRPPYNGRGDADKALAHCNDPIPKLSMNDDDDVPTEVQTVFERMVAKSPSDRYQTGADLVNDLRKLEASGVIAETDSSLDIGPVDLGAETWVESGVDPHAPTIQTAQGNKTLTVIVVASFMMMAITLVAVWGLVSSLNHHPKQRSGTDSLPVQTLLDDPGPPEEIDYVEIPRIEDVDWPVELTDYIYPDRDVIAGGDWTRVDNVLVSGVGGATLLEVRHPVPKYYRLTINVRRTAGDAPMYVGLPTPGSHAYCFLDRKGASGVGLNGNGIIDDLIYSIRLPINELHVLSFEVTADAIRVFLDGEEKTCCHGDTSLMSLPDAFSAGESVGIFIGAKNWTVYVSAFEFESIVLEPIGDANSPDSLAESVSSGPTSP